MAQIVTITNPLTGQPTQVDQLEHTAQEIDDAVAASTVESTDYTGCYYRMVGSVVEWVNPPMALGVEYRTTERYNGKPVYKVALESGSLTIPSTNIIAGTWDTSCTVIDTQILVARPDGSCSTSPNFEDSILCLRHWTRAGGALAIKTFEGLPTGTTVKAVISYIRN